MTRESEWDDVGRNSAEARVYLRNTTCSDCGNDMHRSLTPGHSWDVDDETVCHACASLEMWKRQLRERHKDETTPSGMPTFFEGRIFTVRPAETPDQGGAS